MIWRTALHYAQFWLILALASGQLTNDQKAQIVQLHNQYRTSVNPESANMQRMLWDDAISQVAVKYAARCRWEHNPKIFGILGENLFLTLGPLIITQPFSLWFDERNNYDFGTGTCTAGKLCGHYTQMVWANTTFIGCAAHFCPDVPNFNVQNATLLVCNYYPPGNLEGQSPYKQGTACSSCPNGTVECVSGTCDRGSSITSGLSLSLIANLSSTGNLANTSGAAVGLVKPSAATLLLIGLAALFIRMT